MSARVVIVGGGITGLAAAYRLHRLLPDAALTLVEAEPRLGGKIRTERSNGFVLEAGPDIFLSGKPRGVGLCDELGIGHRLVGTRRETQGSFILRGGRLHPVPEGLTGLVPTRFQPFAETHLLSSVGKLRMLADLFIPPRRGDDDEALATFVTRRLGREAFEWLVDPLLGGIFAGDARQLSLAATFPHLRAQELEHGSLVRAALAARRQQARGRGNGADRAAPAKPGFVSFPTGLAELTEALEESLAPAVDFRRGVAALRIRDTRAPAQDAVDADGIRRYYTRPVTPRAETERPARFTVDLADGAALPADAVVLAAPAYAVAAMLEDTAPELAATLREIPYVTTATVSLAYRRDQVPHPLKGHGYVIPRAEGRPAQACTWVGSKLAGRAPADTALFRVFIGSAGRPLRADIDEVALVTVAREELRETLGVTAAPSLARGTLWDRALPQYTLGHLERVAAAEAHAAGHAGLYLAGAAYHGVGIPDCIASGEAAAERAARELATFPGEAPPATLGP
ncbi:MAG TPA: protoporphyrinogen oxidase [Longimicrobiales bacterium]|nr:protoporphyrinogen oxidase [Longimicrobiales bacterium]